jgi:G6PDH family F420-dependent oxidoreductase
MAKPQIGYAAMLEQFHPTELIDYCVAAESAGFSGVMAADHMQPWTPQQGNAAFVWAFMAVAAERTKGDIGPGVTCPSFRQHPAVIAQAAATLEAMYPGRFWLGLGSGEALNEHIVAPYWPEAPERINRMFEAIEIIRKLFTGKDVKHSGEFFKMETGRIWTMPPAPPPIFVATAGPITAERTGKLRASSSASRRVRARLARIPARCPRSSRSTCPGPPPTKRRWPTRSTNGPTAA